MNLDAMPQVPDLAGKVLSISLVDDSHNHDLADPRFEMQGGRLFVIGSTPMGATISDWTIGVPCAVAWDRVTDYYIFENLEQYEVATKVSSRHAKNNEE